MRLFHSLLAAISLVALVSALGLSGCRQQPSEVKIREPKDVAPPAERGGGAFAGKPVKIPK